MKRLNSYLDIYFSLLITLIFIIITYIFLTTSELEFNQYLLLGLNFLIIVIAYFTNVIVGLISSAFLVFALGSYILYHKFLNSLVSSDNYFWIIVFPLSSFIVGKFGDYISELQENYNRLQNQINNLVTIDEVTGLNNMKEFKKDLEEEMSRAKRHEFGLVLMIIEIQYFEELLNIYGRKKTNKIVKIMASLIEKVTRNEDKRYKIDEQTFAIIMPNTKAEGARIVISRLKKKLENILINNENNEEKLKFDIKFGFLEYNEKIKDALQFKEMTERELEFDV